jgi:hypothetical protein
MTDVDEPGGETAKHLHEDAADAEGRQGLVQSGDHPDVEDPEPERAEHPAEGR